jgi:molybdopterin/thiamine biosynthesis adenylyltransferase
MSALMKQHSEKVSPAFQKALTYGERTQTTGAIGDYSNLRNFFQSSLQKDMQSYQQKTAPVAQEVASTVGSPDAYQTFKLATEGSRRFGSHFDFGNIQKSWQEWEENINKSMSELGIQGFDIGEQFKRWYGG